MATTDLNGSATNPPAGVASNLVNPENEAALAYTTLALALTTVTLFSWFRLLVKYVIIGKLHVEDCKYTSSIAEGNRHLRKVDLIPPAWVWIQRARSFTYRC